MSLRGTWKQALNDKVIEVQPQYKDKCRCIEALDCSALSGKGN